MDNYDDEIEFRHLNKVMELTNEISMLRLWLKEIADCRAFDEHDTSQCSQDIYGWGSALVHIAREALK